MRDPGLPNRVPTNATEPVTDQAPADLRPRRPLIERIGLALVAVVIMAVFGALGAASFASGEPFLGLMAVIGALMTAWAGGLTLFRG